MYSDFGLVLLGLVVFIWLLVLSYLIWRQNSFLGKLFPRTTEGDVRKRFDELLETGSRLLDLEKQDWRHIQKVALLRYNPYEETGGDQSFSLAVLDSKGNGVVLTSLHARGGTRVFAKPVEDEKGTTYHLSKEEIDTVKKAMED